VRRVLADIPCRLEMTRCYAVTLHVQSFKGTRPCDCLERIFAGRLLVVFVSLCLLLCVGSLTLWRSLSPCGDRCPSGGIPPIGTAIGWCVMTSVCRLTAHRAVTPVGRLNAHVLLQRMSPGAGACVAAAQLRSPGAYSCAAGESLHSLLLACFAGLRRLEPAAVAQLRVD